MSENGGTISLQRYCVEKSGSADSEKGQRKKEREREMAYSQTKGFRSFLLPTEWTENPWVTKVGKWGLTKQ